MDGSEYQTRGVIFPGPPSLPLTPSDGAKAVEWIRQSFDRYNVVIGADNPSGPAVIAEQRDMAKTWADRNHLPVYMGGSVPTTWPIPIRARGGPRPRGSRRSGAGLAGRTGMTAEAFGPSIERRTSGSRI